MTAGGVAHWAVLLNLLAPGAGTILLGRIALGLTIGGLFALSANGALWATVLVPDEFPAWARELAVGLAGAVYLATQFHVAHAARSQRQQRRAALRRTALAGAQERLRAGDFAAALQALEPVRDHADRDLLVAFRLAQAHAGMQDVTAAAAAWRRVRALDRHGLYRDACRAAEAALTHRDGTGPAAPARPPGPA